MLPATVFCAPMAIRGYPPARISGLVPGTVRPSCVAVRNACTNGPASTAPWVSAWEVSSMAGASQCGARRQDQRRTLGQLPVDHVLAEVVGHLGDPGAEFHG